MYEIDRNFLQYNTLQLNNPKEPFLKLFQRKHLLKNYTQLSTLCAHVHIL